MLSGEMFSYCLGWKLRFTRVAKIPSQVQSLTCWQRAQVSVIRIPCLITALLPSFPSSHTGLCSDASFHFYPTEIMQEYNWEDMSPVRNADKNKGTEGVPGKPVDDWEEKRANAVAQEFWLFPLNVSWPDRRMTSKILLNNHKERSSLGVTFCCSSARHL